MASATADRLSFLAEHIESGLLERQRARASNVQPDAKNTAALKRSLNTLLQGIEQLEIEQGQLEEGGALSTRDLRESEDVLLGLRRKYDDLHSRLNDDENIPPASTLETTGSQAGPGSSTSRGPGYGRRGEVQFDEAEARDALMGSRDMPASMRKSVRFSDNVDTQELDNTQVLQLHRRIMEEQDDSLDRLSESISRQRELSIQIGDELDSHVQLLDEVDGLVDRHQTRLDGASKKLNTFAKKAAEHGLFTSLRSPSQTPDANLPFRELGRYCCSDYYTGLVNCAAKVINRHDLICVSLHGVSVLFLYLYHNRYSTDFNLHTVDFLALRDQNPWPDQQR
ncbi:hypothetical protein DFH27DRAFT_356088 [Peziza echinospora]|nr:hypothetical protein DFH27DRAFT_356088 [Peziza echinospora]